MYFWWVVFNYYGEEKGNEESTKQRRYSFARSPKKTTTHSEILNKDG
jgi:hypothetical protein